MADGDPRVDVRRAAKVALVAGAILVATLVTVVLRTWGTITVRLTNSGRAVVHSIRVEVDEHPEFVGELRPDETAIRTFPVTSDGAVYVFFADDSGLERSECVEGYVTHGQAHRTIDVKISEGQITFNREAR